MLKFNANIIILFTKTHLQTDWEGQNRGQKYYTIGYKNNQQKSKKYVKKNTKELQIYYKSLSNKIGSFFMLINIC